MHNLELHKRVAQIYSYLKLMIVMIMVFDPSLIDKWYHARNLCPLPSIQVEKTLKMKNAVGMALAKIVMKQEM